MVLPTLLLIFLAALELSRAWLTVNIMTNAAREGARWWAVTETFDSVGAEARITEILTAANLTASPPPSVTCAPVACARDSQVTASVTVNFVPVAGGILYMLDNPLPLTETVIMRRE